MPFLRPQVVPVVATSAREAVGMTLLAIAVLVLGLLDARHGPWRRRPRAHRPGAR